MTMDDRRDRIADPVLADAFEGLRAERPDCPDWERLRRSINERAALPLGRRRRGRTAGLRRASRALVPLAVAAGVAYALWMGPSVIDEVLTPEPGLELASDFDDDMLVHALGGDLTEQEFRLLVTGRANPELLLAFAISER
jgi:hypothetical protein